MLVSVSTLEPTILQKGLSKEQLPHSSANLHTSDKIPPISKLAPSAEFRAPISIPSVSTLLLQAPTKYSQKVHVKKIVASHSITKYVKRSHSPVISSPQSDHTEHTVKGMKETPVCDDTQSSLMSDVSSSSHLSTDQEAYKLSDVESITSLSSDDQSLSDLQNESKDFNMETDDHHSPLSDQSNDDKKNLDILPFPHLPGDWYKTENKFYRSVARNEKRKLRETPMM